MATTTPKEIKANILAGPNEMQLALSLMRTSHGPFDIDMSKATSVTFTTDLNGTNTKFQAAIGGIDREDGSGNSWIIRGWAVNHPSLNNFNGYYNSRTRQGTLRFEVKS